YDSVSFPQTLTVARGPCADVPGPPTVTAVIAYEHFRPLPQPQGPITGGTVVRIFGSGFCYATGVYYGDTPTGPPTGLSLFDMDGTPVPFIVEGDTSILTLSPPGTGLVDITVANAAGLSGTSPADQFQYILRTTA